MSFVSWRKFFQCHFLRWRFFLFSDFLKHCYTCRLKYKKAVKSDFRLSSLDLIWIEWQLFGANWNQIYSRVSTALNWLFTIFWAIAHTNLFISSRTFREKNLKYSRYVQHKKMFFFYSNLDRVFKFMRIDKTWR